MYKSLLIGFLYPLTIIFSGWIQVLVSFISISLGSRIPFLYFFMGISFGIGKIFSEETPFWPGYILGLLMSIFIAYSSINYNKMSNSNSTVSTSASGFIIGSLIGLIIGFF